MCGCYLGGSLKYLQYLKNKMKLFHNCTIIIYREIIVAAYQYDVKLIMLVYTEKLSFIKGRKKRRFLSNDGVVI